MFVRKMVRPTFPENSTRNILFPVFHLIFSGSCNFLRKKEVLRSANFWFLLFNKGFDFKKCMFRFSLLKFYRKLSFFNTYIFKGYALLSKCVDTFYNLQQFVMDEKSGAIMTDESMCLDCPNADDPEARYYDLLRIGYDT